MYVYFPAVKIRKAAQLVQDLATRSLQMNKTAILKFCLQDRFAAKIRPNWNRDGFHLGRKVNVT